MWECDWLRSNSSPAVFGRKSHCILSTWLESTSEVWSSTTWRKTGTGGGRSTHTHTHSSPQTRALLLFVPRDRIKVNMFPFVFLRLWGLAGFGGADWWKKRRPLEACRVEGRLVVGVKTQERLHSWSGVPTDHKGNVLTELPANPEEIKSKRRKK